MRKTCESQDPPDAQALYSNIEDYISDLEEDRHEIVPLFALLGQMKAFLEENYEVE